MLRKRTMPITDSWSVFDALHDAQLAGYIASFIPGAGGVLLRNEATDEFMFLRNLGTEGEVYSFGRGDIVTFEVLVWSWMSPEDQAKVKAEKHRCETCETSET